MIPQEASPGSVRSVTEQRSADGPFPLYRLDGWEKAFEGIVAGITEAAAGSDFSAVKQSAWSFLERIESLGGQLGFGAVVWARQVHGAEVRAADEAPARGVFSPGEADGLVTGRSAALLVVTVADCVPVYLFDPRRRVLGLLHAGWRGAAAGILRRCVEVVREAYGADSADLYLHLGPSICGECYEVGPEVHASFGRSERGPGGLDLRAELARQGSAAGISPDRMSASAWCTRCDLDRFHSHRGRGKTAGRMAAFLGLKRGVERGSGSG